MGYLVTDYTIQVSSTRELASLEIGDSTLLNISLIVLVDSQVSNDLWSEIGILSGGDTADQRSAVLSNGYAGTANSIFWTGVIPTGADARAYAFVEGTAGDSFRLSVLLAPKPQLIVPTVPNAI